MNKIKYVGSYNQGKAYEALGNLASALGVCGSGAGFETIMRRACVALKQEGLGIECPDRAQLVKDYETITELAQHLVFFCNCFEAVFDGFEPEDLGQSERIRNKQAMDPKMFSTRA